METKVTGFFRPRLTRGRPECPIFNVPVSAGHPFPTESFVEGRLDPYEYLIKHPASTFFVRVTGDSMIDDGIHPGDMLVVDRALDPFSQRIVVAIIDGELTVKRLEKQDRGLWLVPSNREYAPIEIQDHQDFEIWGVVTFVIHRV